MQVVLVVHSQKQKMAMDAKRGFGTNERKIFFFSLIDEMLQRSDLW